VNGVNASTWLVARAQAQLGHQVTLLFDEPIDAAASAMAGQAGLALVHVPASSMQYDARVIESLLRAAPPHVVHMHSVFIARQAALARSLVRCGIPYVITPHGGVQPQVLRRGWMRKKLYSLFIERARFYRASAISVLTANEEEHVRAFVPGYTGLIRRVPNPVDTFRLGGHRWKGNVEAKRLVYLGRFDVLCKGIDRLVEIARLAPDMEFRLYGTEDAKTRGWLRRLRRDLPSNVHFHGPVFGADEARVLAEASLYIQTSRWEAWGISVAQAMYVGVPCAIADTLDIAGLLRKYDLGLLLPRDPKKAVRCLLEALSQPARLQQWAARARSFALEHTRPQTVASAFLRLYEEVAVERRRPASSVAVMVRQTGSQF
jgi:glycosyltransferase involved in cell wall biosynthesis